MKDDQRPEPIRRMALTVDEVTELLGVGRNSVYDAVNRGELPHRRIGRRILFSPEALLEWLKAQTSNM